MRLSAPTYSLSFGIQCQSQHSKGYAYIFHSTVISRYTPAVYYTLENDPRSTENNPIVGERVIIEIGIALAITKDGKKRKGARDEVEARSNRTSNYGFTAETEDLARSSAKINKTEGTR